jgi:hypothetical protein
LDFFTKKTTPLFSNGRLSFLISRFPAN